MTRTRAPGRGTRRAFLLALVPLLLLGAVPASALAAAGGPPAAASGVPEGVPPPSSAPVAAVPHPQVSCTGFPVYGGLTGNVWPLSPNFYLQTPCSPIAQDEVHASFGSSGSGSGDRWTIPWYLPPESSNGQENATAGVYLGMVVTGDRQSAYNQSYLELQATPVELTSGFNWTLSLVVLSFVNQSKDSAGCAVALQLSWNDSVWCEFDDLSLNQPISLYNVHGGSWVQATFSGTPGGNGTTVWVNQTTKGNQTANVTLDLAETGTHAFNPAYATACADTCELDWALDPNSGSGQPYGLGVGANICPEGGAAYAYCDSYNGSRWATLAPMEFGVPEYWNGTAYAGTYSVLAPESTSGVCDTSPSLGVIVATCYEYTAAGGDGFYPYFALAGNDSASYLTFGQSYPGTRTSWGGAYGQFSSTSSAQDLVPMAITSVADSSDGGYVPIGTGLNVTDRITALGAETGATLAYEAGGSWTTVAMTRTAGTAEDGAYLGSVPAGPAGTIVYYANATSLAGNHLSVGPRTVLRERLPHFEVTALVTPPGCGTIALNGTTLSNGSSLSLLPGTVPLGSSGCGNYSFSGWTSSPALQVADPGAASTFLTVTGNGTVTAAWRYVRPHVTVTLHVAPSTCGTVSVNGTTYADGSTVSLPYNLAVPLSQTATCGGDVFAGWSVEGNLTILGALLTPDGAGTLTANFLASSGSYGVSFVTNPASCGGIELGGAGYATGETIYLASGSYSVSPAPCAHYGFSSFSTSGGLSVSSGTLTVSAAGTLTENDYKLTEVFVATSPAGCGGVTFNGTNVANGADLVVQNHSVYSVAAFSCAGHYLESVTANGGLTLIGSLLIVNGTGTILVVSFAGTPEIYVGILTHPSTCGGVILGGDTFPNGGFTTEPPGSVLSIQPLPCANYGFIAYVVSGGISIVGSTVWLNNSGAIEVDFGPLVPLLLYTDPATCGTVSLNGNTYADGSEATLIAGVTYSLGATPCAHYGLVAFESAPYVVIANATLTPSGPSTVTAVFAALQYRVPLVTSGVGCGQILVNGAAEPPGARLTGPVATYRLGEQPCATSAFAGWNLTGNLSLTGDLLSVEGNGTVTALFVPAPVTVAIGGPTLAYVGTSVTFLAEVAILVAPTGYTYLWSFGDGSAAASNMTNSTSHAFERSGTFTVSVEVIDPLHRSANATYTITVQGSAGGSSGSSIAYAILAVGVAALVIVLAFLATRRPPRGPGARAPASAQPAAAAPAPAPALPPGPG